MYISRRNGFKHNAKFKLFGKVQLSYLILYRVIKVDMFGISSWKDYPSLQCSPDFFPETIVYFEGTN